MDFDYHTIVVGFQLVDSGVILRVLWDIHEEPFCSLFSDVVRVFYKE